SGHGDSSEVDGRAGPAHCRPRRARSGKNRDAGHLCQSRVARTLRRADFMHHADSFALIRGGHLDLCVLGAFQVAENGDLANWSTSDNDSAPAVGGAMDLAAGARQVWILMEHQTKSGESR